MLTQEQKDMISKKLLEKFNAMNSLVKQIGSEMHDAYNKYTVVDYDYISKYNEDGIFRKAAGDYKTDLINKHYVSSYFVRINSQTVSQWLYCYINNTDPNSTRGSGMLAGWFKEDGKEWMVYCLTEEWVLCHLIDVNRYKTIKEFVDDNADTNPNLIVKLNKALDMEWRHDLIRAVDEYVNACSVAYTEAVNNARKRESDNDNILLAEFGISNSTKSIGVKKFKVTIEEI